MLALLSKGISYAVNEQIQEVRQIGGTALGQEGGVLRPPQDVVNGESGRLVIAGLA